MADELIEMKSKSIGLSLRYKLLAVLTLIPVVILFLYIVMATRLFEKDKLAYVYESSFSVASSLGMQVRMEVEGFQEKAKPILEAYDYSAQNFTPAANDLFAKQTKIYALLLFQRGQNSTYYKLGGLSKDSSFDREFQNDINIIDEVRDMAVQDGVALRDYEKTGKHLMVGYRLGEAQDPNHRIMIALIDADTLYDAFTESNLYRVFLMDRRGQLIFSSVNPADIGIQDDAVKGFFDPMLTKDLPRGTMQLKTPSGVSVLASYMDLRVGQMVLVSLVDKKAALEAVDQLVTKSLLFFLALIAATLMISIFVSFSLTTTLRELLEAAKKIAGGDLGVRVKIRSNDEVGGLAEGFNFMAEEVSRLLTETAQKARMENELSTVKTVQETLFPPNRFDHGNVHLVGHFEPASECGGDWWNYSVIDGKIWLWIGDATGHGAPSALITSAAKAASSIVETLPDMTPAKAMAIMNKAIYATSKGQIMMTFFLGVLDPLKGVLTYANASHDPPYLVRKPEDLSRAISKRDITPLLEVNGTRLGDNKDAVYLEATIQLEKNDTIVFYTDGVMDLQNQKGESLGERAFIKSMLEAVGLGRTVNDKMNTLKDRLIFHRGGPTELKDDVTLFICQYDEAS